MNVGDDGDVAAARAQLRDDVPKIGRVLDRWGGDADELATGLDQFDGLLHAQGGVHRVAGEHGLFDHGVVTPDDEAAFGRIANDDLSGLASLTEVGRLAGAHGSHFAGAGAAVGLELSDGDPPSSICASRLNISLKNGRRRMSKNVT